MRRLVPLLVLALATAAPPAAAATFVAPSVEELARTSDAVVRGRVVDVAARAAAGHRVVTEVEVAVESAWRGAPDATIRVVVPGGRAGGLALKVDSAPELAPGDEVVLFLSRSGATWRLNGQALGTFRVVGQDARAAVEGARVLPGPLADGERRVGTMPLAELERRVRAAR
jgi:hypothetical protein